VVPFQPAGRPPDLLHFLLVPSSVLFHTAGMSRYWRLRILRHLLLAAVSGGLSWGVFRLVHSVDFRHNLSMGTAYAALALTVLALALGPWNVLRARPNPISFDLRRDVGIWAGIMAIFHTVVGLQVHLRGRMYLYFVKRLHPLTWRRDQFGAANYTGLLSALLFLGLLALSNDWSLRRLGRNRWKNLQRWTYLASALMVTHGFFFQAVEKRHAPYVWTLIAAAAATVALQLAGLWRHSVSR